MVKHIIIWTLQDKCFGPNLSTIKENMKTRLEELNGQIPGVQSVVIPFVDNTTHVEFEL